MEKHLESLEKLNIDEYYHIEHISFHKTFQGMIEVSGMSDTHREHCMFDDYESALFWVSGTFGIDIE